MRERLTYANVMATVAMFLSLGAGAYAMGLGRNDVKSRHIDDGTIKSKDVKDRGLFGRDIRDESLNFRQIREDRLDVSQFAKADSAGLSCQPTTTRFIECSRVRIFAEQPSKVLVLAGGGQTSVQPQSRGRCRLLVDEDPVTTFAQIGEVDQSDGTFGNGFAVNVVSPTVGAGSHDVSFRCNLLDGGTRLTGNMSVLVLDAE